MASGFELVEIGTGDGGRAMYVVGGAGTGAAAGMGIEVCCTGSGWAALDPGWCCLCWTCVCGGFCW